MKKRIIYITMAIIIAGILFATFATKGFGSGFQFFGKELGETISKTGNPVVAKVNGTPIYLSDVAIPYFSMSVSYLKTKQSLVDYLNNPNIKESMKNSIRETLAKDAPDPVKVLNKTIGLELLKQYMQSKGVKVSDSVIENREKQIMQSIEKNGGMWKKYEDQLIKSLGMTRKEYFDTYYKRYLEYEYYADRYLKSIKVPKINEDQIKSLMSKRGVDRSQAIEMLENEYAWNHLFNKEKELRQNANVEIINIQAVNNLKKYFLKD